MLGSSKFEMWGIPSFHGFKEYLTVTKIEILQIYLSPSVGD